MNQAGKDYFKQMLREANKLGRQLKIPVPAYKWTDGPMQERILRLGVELCVYDCDIWDTKHMEELAYASLLEDWINRNGVAQYSYSCAIEKTTDAHVTSIPQIKAV